MTIISARNATPLDGSTRTTCAGCRVALWVSRATRERAEAWPGGWEVRCEGCLPDALVVLPMSAAQVAELRRAKAAMN